MISINRIKKRKYTFGTSLLILLTLSLSCKKQVIQEDPYKGGKESLGVKFTSDEPDPASGSPGNEVTFKINGLAKYKGDFEFLINETKAQVLGSTDSTLTVKVPENASTGGTTLLLDGQSFFGPKFTVEGKVTIDASFKAVNGTNGAINDILATPDGNYMLVGGFTNFESQAPAIPVNRIVMIASDGSFQSSLSAKEGADGTLQSIHRLNSGKYLVSGGFSSFNKRKGINGLTRLNSNGSLDTAIVELINIRPENPLMGLDTVAAFNGGVYGSVAKSFVKDGKTTLLGNFNNYVSYYYYRSTRDLKVPDVTKMAQLVRLKEDGSMDSTFNFNEVTKTSYAGGNGAINGAFMQADGKIVAVGSFTTFHGVSANYIVRINLDGTVDPGFATGTGADGAITSISYNTITGKILLAGSFKNFNGKARSGVVMLNTNGSVDDTFQFPQVLGGVPNYASQLNNGKVLVSGGFNSYNGVIRQGFMILNQDGTLAQGYNNTGAFQGRVLKVLETTSALGNPAVILVGDFNKFDNRKVGNIVRVEIRQ